VQLELVKIENVWVYIEKLLVLEDISLSVDEGDFVGIIGPNGGGKTTLLKVILGLIPPLRGHVSILGKSPERARRKIGYVPQYNLFDRNFPLNVRDVVMMGRLSKKSLFGQYGQKDREMTEQALDQVGMLSFWDKQIGTLSGGEQQRVFIARALVSRPKLLLLDEPTAGVDTAMQTELFELLEKLKSDMAIVMVSHDISVVSVYVKKIACLNQRLYYHGTKEITPEILEATYKCPVQMIAHGTVPHRVLKEH
jgi:zinc transport system ATP-binding protein